MDGPGSIDKREATGPLAVPKWVATALPHLVFLGLVGLVTFLRWKVLQATDYPPGLDGGNWLAYGHALLGEHVRSSSLVYPPVVPIQAVVSEWLFGSFTGLRLLALVASVAPAIGLYVLLADWGLRWRAAVLAGFLASSAATGQAVAWGGYPQLIGLGILPVFILTLERFLLSRRLVTALPPAVLLLVALSTSEFVGPFSAVVGVIYLIIRYPTVAAANRANSLRNVLAGVGIAVLLALSVAPVYLALLPGVTMNEQTKLLVSRGQTLATLTTIISGPKDLQAAFWLLALLLALVAPITLFARTYRLPLLTAAVLLPALVLLIWTGEPRLTYLLPLGILLGLGAWREVITRFPTLRRSCDAAVVTFLVLDIVASASTFAIQRDFYAVVSPGLAQGFTKLADRSTPNQLIAVSPAQHDWELGWWIEGVAHRRAVYAGNPIWLTYADERQRNATANRIYARDGDIGKSTAEARRIGAAYLFVDKRWSAYASWRGRPASSDFTVVYENDSVLIVGTGA